MLRSVEKKLHSNCAILVRKFARIPIIQVEIAFGLLIAFYEADIFGLLIYFALLSLSFNWFSWWSRLSFEFIDPLSVETVGSTGSTAFPESLINLALVFHFK